MLCIFCCVHSFNGNMSTTFTSSIKFSVKETNHSNTFQIYRLLLIIKHTCGLTLRTRFIRSDTVTTYSYGVPSTATLEMLTICLVGGDNILERESTSVMWRLLEETELINMQVHHFVAKEIQYLNCLTLSKNQNFNYLRSKNFFRFFSSFFFKQTRFSLNVK